MQQQRRSSCSGRPSDWRTELLQKVLAMAGWAVGVKRISRGQGMGKGPLLLTLCWVEEARRLKT
jgi:hypothetical protein